MPTIEERIETLERQHQENRLALGESLVYLDDRLAKIKAQVDGLAEIVQVLGHYNKAVGDQLLDHTRDHP